MGTWLGHAAPGLFFILFSFWWTVRSMHRYYSRQGRRHENSLIHLCCCGKMSCLGRLPLDNWVLIFVAALGVIMEIATSMASMGKMVLGNQQHLMMYISFGLVGMVSILVHHRIKFIPKGAEYMTLLVALMVELVLFRYHLHGRVDADIHIHMLLVYTIGGCIVAVSLEMLYPHSVNALVARCYFFLLQGTWFFQIAFTLYPPAGVSHWDFTNPESVMLITLVYSWHMIGCLMVMLILSGLTYWCCSPRCQGEYSEEAGMNLLPRDASKGFHGDNDTSHSSALMNGYNSVASDEEDQLYSVVEHKPPH